MLTNQTQSQPVSEQLRGELGPVQVSCLHEVLVMSGLWRGRGALPCSESSWTEIGVAVASRIQSDMKGSSSGESTLAAKHLPF